MVRWVHSIHQANFFISVLFIFLAGPALGPKRNCTKFLGICDTADFCILCPCGQIIVFFFCPLEICFPWRVETHQRNSSAIYHSSPPAHHPDSDVHTFVDTDGLCHARRCHRVLPVDPQEAERLDFVLSAASSPSPIHLRVGWSSAPQTLDLARALLLVWPIARTLPTATRPLLEV